MLTVEHCQRAWRHAQLAYLFKKGGKFEGCEVLELADAPRVKIDYNGHWVHLDGLTYNGLACHLTITPGPAPMN